MKLNQNGFSLIGVMAGIAGSGVLILVVMQIAQMSSSINAMMSEGNELQNQVFIGRLFLADQTTCTLNLAGTEISGDRVKIEKILKQKDAGGAVLGTSAIFPVEGINSARSFQLRSVTGVPNLLFLDVDFNRNRIFGANQTVTRSIPLKVTMSGNRVVTCSAGDDGSTTTNNSTTTNSGSSALPAFGNCDKSSEPSLGTVFDNEKKSSVERGRITFCDTITYPVSEDGKMDCSKLNDPTVFHLAGRFMERHGVNCRPLVSIIGGAGGAINNSPINVEALAGLSSREECMKLPITPAGTKLGSYRCVNGAWKYQ